MVLSRTESDTGRIGFVQRFISAIAIRSDSISVDDGVEGLEFESGEIKLPFEVMT